MCRVPQLHDGAREDVFLRVRRLLAVHLEQHTVAAASEQLSASRD